jgi:hypothetical protein
LVSPLARVTLTMQWVRRRCSCAAFDGSTRRDGGIRLDFGACNFVGVAGFQYGIQNIRPGKLLFYTVGSFDGATESFLNDIQSNVGDSKNGDDCSTGILSHGLLA